MILGHHPPENLSELLPENRSWLGFYFSHPGEKKNQKNRKYEALRFIDIFIPVSLQGSPGESVTVQWGIFLPPVLLLLTNNKR